MAWKKIKESGKIKASNARLCLPLKALLIAALLKEHVWQMSNLKNSTLIEGSL